MGIILIKCKDKLFVFLDNFNKLYCQNIKNYDIYDAEGSGTVLQ
jgi:hypothetical protein